MEKLAVNIEEKNTYYPIYISNENIEILRDKLLQEVEGKNYIVIFSQKVHKLYSKILNFPKDKILILKDGETEKNFQNYTKILNFALSRKLTRKDAIIAIGGGVIGDLAGFSASTYMRGIKFIQVPTTLLAATDSSVGGKTAINTKYGKNLVGTFYQPNSVFINVNFIKTLDERQFKSGLGEVVKYGLIEKTCPIEDSPNLINFLNEHSEKILARDILTLQELIKICISLKIEVVKADEKEGGLRKILNLGHTFGHAIENITKYKKFTHGECVAKGVKLALDFSFRQGLIDKGYKFLCEDLIKKFNFKPIPKFDRHKMVKAMLTDKKAEDNYIVFILPTNYAEVKGYKFTTDELLKLL